MATNVSIAKQGKVAFRKVLLKLNHNNIQHLIDTIWVVASADPVADSTSAWAATPVKVGHFVYRVDDDEVFICSVANASATSAQFIQCHA